jgi:hypothetical protein
MPQEQPIPRPEYQAQPMNADLSWTTWYGFSLMMGWRGHRDVTVIAKCQHTNHMSLIRDDYTKRLFVMDDCGGIVQYTRDSVETFK